MLPGDKCTDDVSKIALSLLVNRMLQELQRQTGIPLMSKASLPARLPARGVFKSDSRGKWVLGAHCQVTTAWSGLQLKEHKKNQVVIVNSRGGHEGIWGYPSMECFRSLSTACAAHSSLCLSWQRTGTRAEPQPFFPCAWGSQWDIALPRWLPTRLRFVVFHHWTLGHCKTFERCIYFFPIPPYSTSTNAYSGARLPFTALGTQRHTGKVFCNAFWGLLTKFVSIFSVANTTQRQTQQRNPPRSPYRIHQQQFHRDSHRSCHISAELPEIFHSAYLGQQNRKKHQKVANRVVSSLLFFKRATSRTA